MTDAEDMKLKDKIDEIMKDVENIMKKVDLILPAKQEESQTHGE